MAFAASVKAESVFGNMRAMMGTYTQGNGDTGGAIVTGLNEVKFFSAVGATKQATVKGTVTIVTADPTADVTGYWLALGY